MDERKKRKQADGEDSKDLGPTCGNFIIGYVDEVNGPGAAAVSAFVPTRNELIQLVKYWADVAMHRRFFFFVWANWGHRGAPTSFR